MDTLCLQELLSHSWDQKVWVCLHTPLWKFLDHRRPQQSEPSTLHSESTSWFHTSLTIKLSNDKYNIWKKLPSISPCPIFSWNFPLSTPQCLQVMVMFGGPEQNIELIIYICKAPCLSNCPSVTLQTNKCKKLFIKNNTLER